MSRAFVKENDDGAVPLPDRPISTYPNFVTEAGRAAIETALQRFEAAHRAAVEKSDAQALREIRFWSARLATAQVVRPAADTA
jgi:transcription elongation GreA/GreB family factor